MSKNPKTWVQRCLSWVKLSTRLCNQLNSTHHKNSCTQLKISNTHWNQGTSWDSSNRGTWKAHSGTSYRWCWCSSSNSKPKVYKKWVSYVVCLTACHQVINARLYVLTYRRIQVFIKTWLVRKLRKRLSLHESAVNFRKGFSKIVKFHPLDHFFFCWSKLPN